MGIKFFLDLQLVPASNLVDKDPSLNFARLERPWEIADHVTAKLPVVNFKSIKSAMFLETRDLLFIKVFSTPKWKSFKE